MKSLEEGKALIGLYARTTLLGIVGRIVAVKLREDVSSLAKWDLLGEIGYHIDTCGRISDPINEWHFRSEFRLLSPLEQIANASQEDEE